MESNQLQQSIPVEKKSWWGLPAVAVSESFKQRQRKRTAVSVALFGCWVLVLVVFRIAGVDLRTHERIFQVWGVLLFYLPIWGYSIVGMTKDLAYLDELARRVHVESMAWTYITGLTLAGVLFGVNVLTGVKFNPFWFLLLEPVRMGWLYFVSRRYQ